MKRQKQTVRTLADFGRRQRTAIVCEVIRTMLDVDSLAFGDALNDHGAQRALAERFGIPFLVLHMLVDSRIGAADLHEWCAFERGKAVA